MEAIILAGGLGTRLRPALPDKPKPMAPIGSRPFLAVLLEYLERQSIDRVVLSVGFLGHVIIEYFGRRYRSIEIDYAIEHEPLGTGGAIINALPLISNASTFVVNGDTYSELDYQAMMVAHQSQASPPSPLTIALRRVADASRFGAASTTNGRISAFHPEGARGPGLISCGVYRLSRHIFSGYDLPDAFSFERDFLSPNIERLHAVAFCMSGRFIDIGVPEEYERARRELAEELRFTREAEG